MARIRRHIAPFILGGSIIIASSVFAQMDEGIGVRIDEQPTAVIGTIIDGRTMVPLSALAAELGFEVQQNEKRLVLSKGETEIHAELETHAVAVNDHDAFIDVPPMMVDGALYVPLRFVAEQLGYAVWWNAEDRNVHLHVLETNDMRIHTVKETEESGILKLKVQYPRIEGLENAEVERKINDFFVAHSERAKDAAYRDSVEFRDDMPPGYSYTLDVNYEVRYNQNGLLSVVFNDYTYTGGAHGMTYRTAYTIDLATGDVLQLKDLFKEDSDFVEILSEEIGRQFAVRELPLLTPFESIDEDADFALTHEGLAVFFQLYEYTPYAYGFPEFVFRYDELAEMLAIEELLDE